MRRRARGAAVALALSMLIIGLLAPSAVARKAKYAGPLLGPPAQTPGSSMVFFRVVSKGNGAKLRPVRVLKFKTFNLNVSCTDAAGNEAEPSRVSFQILSSQTIPVSNREFAYTYTFNRGHFGGSGFETFEIRGRIPSQGPRHGDRSVHGELYAAGLSAGHLRFHYVLDSRNLPRRNPRVTHTPAPGRSRLTGG